MRDVNGWLMVLSFLIGLVLTLGLMVRRVTREVPVAHTVSAAAGAGATASTLTGAAVQADPYGSGSIRTAASAAVPAGHADYTIKGNEDSMLYHTPESPWYGQTIAEVWFADEQAAQRAGFARWDSGRKGTGAVAAVASVEDVGEGPYGRGSAKPNADGSGPAGWTVKGNADSMLYHPTDSPAYSETIAEVWFFDEETAKAAGFDKWDKNFR